MFSQLDSSSENDKMKSEEKRICSTMTIIINTLGFALVIGAALVFQILYIDTGDKNEEVVINWTSDNDV